MASQNHGFQFQSLLLEIYGATPEELHSLPYTAKMDLPGTLNRIDPGIAISCKVTGNAHKVDMADCLRVYDSIDSEPYHLLVATYIQDDTTSTKRIAEIIELNMTISGVKEALFGTLTREEIEALVILIKAVPRGRSPTDEERTAIYSLRDALHTKTGALQLAPKMDSAGQRRLQCSFSHFQRFVEEHPELIIARGTPTDFRGRSLTTDTISSGRRRRIRVSTRTATTAPSSSMTPPPPPTTTHL